MKIKNSDFQLMIGRTWDNKITILLDCIYLRKPGYINIYLLSFHWKGPFPDGRWGYRHSLKRKQGWISITNFAPAHKSERMLKKENVGEAG
jgi:hypothetical protein